MNCKKNAAAKLICFLPFWLLVTTLSLWSLGGKAMEQKTAAGPGVETIRPATPVQLKNDTKKKQTEFQMLMESHKTERKITIFLVIVVILSLLLILVLLIMYRSIKKAHRRLRVSDSRYKELFSHAGDAIFVLDGPTFVDCNEESLEIFGVTRDEIIGHTFNDFSPQTQPGNRISWEAGMGYITKTMEGEHQRFSWRHSKKDGTPIEAVVSLTPITIDDKRLILAIVHDISDRVKLEEEKLKSAKLETVSLLAGGIAHDFNNLLAVILGNLDLFQLPGISEKKQKSSLLAIEAAANSAASLADKFLTIAEGGYPCRETTVIGNDIREATSEALRDSNKNSGKETSPDIDLRLDIPGDLWPINGNVTQIRRVVAKLTLNALDAVGTKGKIKWQAANIQLNKGDLRNLEAGRYIRLTIDDNGEGIPQENLSRIFDPYFSTRQDFNRKGLGMGLAVTQAIVKRHNGAILVDSQLGEGTTVKVYFPACEESSIQE